MRLKIAKADWQTEAHTNSVRKLLTLMSGVEVVVESSDSIEVEATDEAAEVLNDMNVCDYLMLRAE